MGARRRRARRQVVRRPPLGHVRVGLSAEGHPGVPEQPVRPVPPSRQLPARLDPARPRRSRPGRHRAARDRDRRPVLRGRARGHRPAEAVGGRRLRRGTDRPGDDARRRARQRRPDLFALVVLGLLLVRRSAWAGAAPIVLAGILKLFPAFAVVVLLRLRRRWPAALASIVVLGVVRARDAARHPDAASRDPARRRQLVRRRRRRRGAAARRRELGAERGRGAVRAHRRDRARCPCWRLRC